MSGRDVMASNEQVELFRAWVSCPSDFQNTPKEIATAVSGTLFGTDAAYIQAWQLLDYLRGKPMPLRAFKAIEAQYMR